jgi:radical SAM superfamily enzyme YgiQ (UPF0313 family)
MSARRILLVNPTITSHPRFPLAVMQLAAALRSQRHAPRILDGNVDRDFVATACAAVRAGEVDAVGVTVMGGPQLPPAIAVSDAIRAIAPGLPIVWGGYFPTICPDAALNGTPVDYVVRGLGDVTLVELLAAHFDEGAAPAALAAIDGLSWRRRGPGDAAEVVHNPDRAFSPASLQSPPDFDGLDRPQRYLSPTYLGRRTTGWQAALGCRYRCTFCGVAAMFRGKTALPTAQRLEQDLVTLKTRFGADSINFYDHNFFDRDVDMAPLLEVLARHELPWWCFARADALLDLSDRSWALVRRSRLRMAYIGAESPSDSVLHDLRKGTRADQTLDVVEKCRHMGVVPELSFMLAPPQDPEGETERTFEFIRRVKRLNPATEVMLYIHTPLPPRRHALPGGRPINVGAPRDLAFPDSAAGWAAPAWVDYWCHQDAPWLTERLRRRIEDFRAVLGCRFPTLTDIRTPAWQKSALRGAAAWRYGARRYDRPWELALLQRFVRLWEPQLRGL